jgi:hypothetical protein
LLLKHCNLRPCPFALLLLRCSQVGQGERQLLLLLWVGQGNTRVLQGWCQLLVPIHTT